MIITIKIIPRTQVIILLINDIKCYNCKRTNITFWMLHSLSHQKNAAETVWLFSVNYIYTVLVKSGHHRCKALKQNLNGENWKSIHQQDVTLKTCLYQRITCAYGRRYNKCDVDDDILLSILLSKNLKVNEVLVSLVSFYSESG